MSCWMLCSQPPFYMNSSSNQPLYTLFTWTSRARSHTFGLHVQLYWIQQDKRIVMLRWRRLLGLRFYAKNQTDLRTLGGRDVLLSSKAEAGLSAWWCRDSKCDSLPQKGLAPEFPAHSDVSRLVSFCEYGPGCFNTSEITLHWQLSSMLLPQLDFTWKSSCRQGK